MGQKQFQSSDPRQVATIVLYGKPVCPLCDEAESLIQQVARSMRVQVRKVDVTSDAVLYRRYGLEIPVLELPAGQILRWPFSADDIIRALDSQ